jgi:membrane-bound metal-dependent hydrolase YbcI (DUF457 family)
MVLMKHRGLSHHPVTWIVVFIAAGADYYATAEPLIASTLLAALPFNIGATLFTGFFSGVSLHLFCDWLTIRGLPLSWDGKRRTSLSSLRTGSPTEYFIAVSFLVISISLRMGLRLL